LLLLMCATLLLLVQQLSSHCRPATSYSDAAQHAETALNPALHRCTATHLAASTCAAVVLLRVLRELASLLATCRQQAEEARCFVGRNTAVLLFALSNSCLVICVSGNMARRTMQELCCC
jgi:hypothetical protein